MSNEQISDLRSKADQGDAMAQNALGVLYDKGNAITKNCAMAREWYEKAATQGYALAQYNLGGLYEAERGVQQDYVRSYMWYGLAAQGEPGYRDYVDEKLVRLKKVMTPQQLQEAQRLARNWIVKK
jgi:hypothetical protein